VEPRHPDRVVDDLIGELARSRDAVGDAGEWVECLERALARVESFVTAEVGRFDASGAYLADGARDAAAWLSTRARLSRAAARAQVRRGRARAEHRAFAAAWDAGEITGAHLDVVVSVDRPATHDALVRDASILVGHARTLRYSSFCRAVAYFEQLADPDGTEGCEQRRRDGRSVELSRGFAGTWLGSMTLDAISGEIVANELERIGDELFATDWSAARDALGRDPLSGELARSARQRRADALVEMATRSAAAAPAPHRPAPLFTVLVGYESLHGRICETERGTVVTPGALLAHLDGAHLERAVFAPGRRVEIGVRTRLFTGATRRALEVRDRMCAHPYCEEPAARCEADHIVQWAFGGETTQENGRLLCAHHNRMRNSRPPPS